MQVRKAWIDRAVQRRWARAAGQAGDMALAELRRERAMARKLLSTLTEMTVIADNRLALPLIGSHIFPKPHGTDWAWRPPLWRLALACPGMASAPNGAKLGEGLTLFHNCARSELTLRQIRNTRATDLAPYGLRMEVFAFEGSFLSVVLDLPDDSIDGLRKSHLLRLSTLIELEKPLGIYARLNIKHGPNTERFVRELPVHEQEIMVEFDLAYSNLNEKRIEQAWVDLIFETPAMSQIILRDLTFSRRPRAEF